MYINNASGIQRRTINKCCRNDSFQERAKRGVEMPGAQRVKKCKLTKIHFSF